MSQAASSKGRENVSKQKTYASLNLNQTFIGSKAEIKTSSGTQRHGMQLLGKVNQARRLPPPANLPSLKKENLGNDPSVNLVPSGKSGWGKKEKESKQEQQQPSPSIQVPVSTATQEEVSLRPNAGAVPKQGESKKSWSSTKPVVSSNIVTGTTPPASTYFQREFPSLGDDGVPGRQQSADGAVVAGELRQTAGEEGPKQGDSQDDPSFQQQERDPKHPFNGNPALQQQRPQFYPQQQFGEHFVNTQGAPPMFPMAGFHPLHPSGPFPFPIPAGRKDHMPPFDQHYMRMPMHGAHPPFPSSDADPLNSDRPPQPKKPNTHGNDSSSSSRIDWADTQEEVDYNVKLKFDESDCEASPPSSPKPHAAKPSDSVNKPAKDNQGKQSAHAKDKEASPPSTAAKQPGEPGPTREAWAEMFPGYQGGPMPMQYSQKWGMGFMPPPYDGRHPAMPMPHPYHQYPPSWFFMQQQQQQQRSSSQGPKDEGIEGSESQSRTKPDPNVPHELWEEKKDNASSSRTHKDATSQGALKEETKKQDASSTSVDSNRKDGSEGEHARISGVQHRHPEQSFSKSNEVPPRFRNKNQQRHSPSNEHTAKSSQNDESSHKSNDKTAGSNADGSLRKIIKRRDSVRSEDSVSIHSHDGSEKHLYMAKGDDSSHRSSRSSKSTTRTDEKESLKGKSSNDQISKKPTSKNEKTSSNKSGSKPNSQEKYEKNKSTKSKSVKEGMKKLEKSKSRLGASTKSANTNKSKSETDPEKPSSAATTTTVTGNQQTPATEPRKTAWASVVTGDPAESVGAVGAETKKSLLEIQKEQGLKDALKKTAVVETERPSASHRPHQDDYRERHEKQPYRNNRDNHDYDRPDKQSYRNRDDHGSGSNYRDRRNQQQEDRKRKFNDGDQQQARFQDGSNRNYSNRKEHSGYNNDQRPGQNRHDRSYPSNSRGRYNEDDRRGDGNRSYRSAKPGLKDDQRKNNEVQSHGDATGSGESNIQAKEQTASERVTVPAVEDHQPIDAAKVELESETVDDKKKDKNASSDGSKREYQSTRRKESEKYSSKYQNRYDDRKHAKSNDRPSNRGDRRRDPDEKHPDRLLFTGRNRGPGRGSTRDAYKSKSNQQHSSSKHSDGKVVEEAISTVKTDLVSNSAPVPTASAADKPVPQTENTEVAEEKLKPTSWSKLCETEDEAFESCSDTDENKVSSKPAFQPRGKGTNSSQRTKSFDRQGDGGQSSQYRKNDNVGRGRGRNPRRGTGRVGSKPGYPKAMGRGRSPRDNRAAYSAEHTAPTTSQKEVHDESSDNSAEYHSAGETAVLPESTADDGNKTDGKSANAERPGHGGRGAKRVSRGRGTKTGHFLGHRQQAGGRLGDSSLLVDPSPAADNQDSNALLISREENRTARSKSDTPSSEGGASDAKKGRITKQPPPKVNIFNTFDVRDIASVVCIDDRPQEGDSQLMLKNAEEEDDDGFVEVTYKRGGQKEQREKEKKDIRKKSRDDNQKSSKQPGKNEQKNAATKPSKSTKSPGAEAAARVSPTIPVCSSPTATSFATVQGSQNSNAAMAAVGEWEPARSLMRSTSNTQGSVEQPPVPGHPLTPPPGNAWQRPLSFASSNSAVGQHTQDPKAVGSGKPKSHTTAFQTAVEQHLPSAEETIVADVISTQECSVELAAPTDQTVPVSTKRKAASRSTGKEKGDRSKPEAKSPAVTKQPNQKRDAKKSTERRPTREKAPRFQTQNRIRVSKKESTGARSSTHKNEAETVPHNAEIKCEDGKSSNQKSSLTNVSGATLPTKVSDEEYSGEVSLNISNEQTGRLMKTISSPTKLLNRPFSEQDAQNAKDTARSVIKSLGDDDERNLETKSLPGTPPLAVDIPEPTLSGPSSDPGHQGSPGPRSMVHEFTEMSRKILSTKIKEVWDNPISDSRGGHGIASQAAASSWSDASIASESAVASVAHSSAEQEIVHQSDVSDVLGPNNNAKRDDSMPPLQRTQDALNSKRLPNNAHNVCKVKPRQQQAEMESKQQLVYSSSPVLSSQHANNVHQSIPTFQTAPGQKGQIGVSQFVVTADRRATQVVQPTVIHSEREYNEAIHHQQAISLQQAHSTASRLHSTSPLSQSSQDLLQQRMVMNNVYGQPGISMQQNQMLAPWQVIQNQAQTGAAGSFRSQVHHTNPMFNASPVSLHNSTVYMAFDPQVGSSAPVLQSQSLPSQLSHQPVGMMLPRQLSHHQNVPQSGPYLGVQGQQYHVRPQLIGNIPEMSQSDNSALINHVNAKPFKPQTGPTMQQAPSTLAQHVVHNQLIASVLPRPLPGRSMPTVSSPQMPLHDHARLSSPPVDPNMQFVAAGMPMKGHHMLPQNAALSQHMAGPLPPQLFRQQQPGATFVQRPVGPMQPRYQRPIPGPIQRPGSGAVPLSSQVVAPSRPRPSVPYQTVQSMPANVVPAQSLLYNQVQPVVQPGQTGGFRNLQHQKMIADTQKFFQHTEPVQKRAILPERSSEIIDSPVEHGGNTTVKTMAESLSPVISPSNPDNTEPHQELLATADQHSSKEATPTVKNADTVEFTNKAVPSKEPQVAVVPANVSAAEL